MAYEQPKTPRRNFWPISSYGGQASGGGGGVASMPVGPHGGLCNSNGNSDFHFLQASSFLQELIDSNRKRGSQFKSQGGPLGPPPPPPPSSGNREAYGMEDGRQRLIPPTPTSAQQPSPQGGNMGDVGGQPGDPQHWNFAGQKMWQSDKNGQVEDDFRLEYMVEYMELDEFLTENDIPLESVLQDQQQQPPPPPPGQPQVSAEQHPSAEDNAACKPSSTDHSSTQPPHPQPTPNAAVNVTQPHTQPPQPKMGPPPMANSPPINPPSSASSGDMDGNGLIKSECVGGHAPGPPPPHPQPQPHDYGDYGGGGGPLPPMNGAPLCGGGDKGVVSLPPPPPPPPLDSSAVTSSLLRKRKKQMVSEERKDEKYWERRRKNNMAAKRSRDARRAKETQIAIQATLLERENKSLTQELSKARAENLLLRERLQKYEPV